MEGKLVAFSHCCLANFVYSKLFSLVGREKALAVEPEIRGESGFGGRLRSRGAEEGVGKRRAERGEGQIGRAHV